MARQNAQFTRGVGQNPEVPDDADVLGVDADLQAGDGVDVPVIKARSAERRGVIWILALSLGAAVVALGLYWLIFHLSGSGGMGQA